MPKQSLLQIIKRWRRYELRADWKYLLPVTRGVYVLYKKQPDDSNGLVYHVKYIGVAGISKDPKSGIHHRLKKHHQTRKDWTHYSFFEVHDNVSREEILELESLLLAIFRHDHRIKLENKQKSSTILTTLRKITAWKDVK